MVGKWPWLVANCGRWLAVAVGDLVAKTIQLLGGADCHGESKPPPMQTSALACAVDKLRNTPRFIPVQFGRIPFEYYQGRKPNLCHLEIFGCLIVTLNNEYTEPANSCKTKFSPQASLGLFLGFDTDSGSIAISYNFAGQTNLQTCHYNLHEEVLGPLTFFVLEGQLEQNYLALTCALKENTTFTSQDEVMHLKKDILIASGSKCCTCLGERQLQDEGEGRTGWLRMATALFWGIL
ncbi:hypothetical protein DFJ73DRAFT_766530 [Zopfochytrium polystomum]|nr:hypothetical protein DFJ73DRAFT_766530 [Zopfochytrium polystomum]